MREFTLRGVILGALITLAFTAANVYLGLKVGLTFASAIPAAVISMALLYRFKDSNILENNLVQTQASAAGTLSSVIFVLPALLMLGLWTGFPFWQTALICAAGGTLGVLYTIPLRRVMVVQSDLPYPEGVAAAGVLRAMGYRTQVSPPGADRGRDILASPDGFGFQQPRIVVEVKHRAGRMGSAEVRRFLGGRHRDDRGLFVSTGGFTREAHYEADRAQVPLALWTLDELTRTLLDNYPGTDTETKRLIPLRMFYVPA